MEVANIEITKLYVSNINVRKTLTSEEDETGITDLANDINTNGLINPITIRLNNNKYEIIAGQRRYLAMKQLNKTYIPCNILNIDTQKAEEYLNTTRTDLPTLEANADIQQTNAAADYLKQTSTPALGTANAAESNSFTVNKAITPSSNDSPVQTPKWGKQKEYDPKTGDWKKNIFGKDKLFKVRAVDNAQN
jgi:ParB family chromosome partitioning protein